MKFYRNTFWKGRVRVTKTKAPSIDSLVDDALADDAPWTPDFKDRRRLAVAEILLIAERSGGQVYPQQYGAVILRHVTGEGEVIEMATATNRSLVSLLNQRNQQ